MKGRLKLFGKRATRFLYDYKREQVVKNVQVSRCRIFYEKEGQDPRSLGAALAGKSIVEAVLGYRGASGKRKTVRDVKVLVKWADESAARWEPLANIR